MSTKSLTSDQAHENAQIIAEQLDTLRADAQRRLDRFTVFVERYKQGVDNPLIDGRSLTSASWAERIREEVEALHHIHTGGDEHLHFRGLMSALFNALTGEELKYL